MDNENNKIYTEGIRPQGKLYRWFDNFWYHNKWTVIIVSCFLIVFIVCTAQTCAKKEDDLPVVYAGPSYIGSAERQSICNALSAVLTEDINKDGRLSVSLSSFQI